MDQTSGRRRAYFDHENVYRKKRADGWTGWDPPGSEDSLASFQDFLRSPYLPSPSRALDLGCGGGEIAITLAARGWDVVGIDYSNTAIEMARDNAARAGVAPRFLVADLTQPKPVQEDDFALLLDNHVLHCLIGSTDRSRFLKNAYSALTPGGVFFSANISAEGHLDYSRHSIEPVVRVDAHHTRFWVTREELLTELHRAGFRIVHCALHERHPEEEFGAEIVVYAVKQMGRRGSSGDTHPQHSR